MIHYECIHSSRCRHGLVRLEEDLMAVIGGSLVSYLDRTVDNIKRTSPPTIPLQHLKDALQRAEVLHIEVTSIHLKVLQSHGVGEKLSQVEVTSRRITDIIHALEDVLLHASLDVRLLMEIHQDRQFFYQTISDVVPIM